MPATSGTGEPTFVPESWNRTKPSGVPAPGGRTVTFACKITGFPYGMRLLDEKASTAVLAGSTLCITGTLVLVQKCASPEYRAVIVWVPTGSVVKSVAPAVPPLPLSGIGAPRLAPPFWNCRLPDGVLEPRVAATFAWRRTGCPKTVEPKSATVKFVPPLLSSTLKPVTPLPTTTSGFSSRFRSPTETEKGAESGATL